MRVSSWNNFCVFYTRFLKPRLKFLRQMLYVTHIVETAKRIYCAPEFFYYAHPC